MIIEQNFQIQNGQIIFRGEVLSPKAWMDTTKLPESRFQEQVRKLIEGAGEEKVGTEVEEF